MERRKAIDISGLDGKFGQITLQREYEGKVQERIIFGTINLKRNVIQELLWKDIELDGDIRIVDFSEIDIFGQNV